MSPRIALALLTICLSLVACARDTGLGPSAEDARSAFIPADRVDGGDSPGRPERPRIIPHQMVVKLSPGVQLEQFHRTWGTTTILHVEDSEYVLVATDGQEFPPDLAQRTVEAGDCAIAEPNYGLETPESQQGTVAFYEGNAVPSDLPDQGAMTRIGLEAALTVSTGAGILVAVLDTGVDATHPDLASSISALGWDFVDEDANPDDEPGGIAAGHGTHVAGIVHTIAPSATILPVRVLGPNGQGSTVGVARGVRWAIQRGADVINLSLGLDVDSDVMKEAIDDAHDAGILVVSAAGNAGAYNNEHFPARLSRVASVASTDSLDLKSGFSNWSSHVSMSAPGDGILSTYLDHGYATWSGTSFSTPMISGAAALWLQAHPAASPDETIDEIEESAFALAHESRPYEGKMGEGRLDLAALFQVVPDRFAHRSLGPPPGE